MIFSREIGLRPAFFWIFSSALSTPKLMPSHPALAMARTVSSSRQSGRVSHFHLKTRPRRRISSQISTTRANRIEALLERSRRVDDPFPIHTMAQSRDLALGPPRCEVPHGLVGLALDDVVENGVALEAFADVRYDGAVHRDAHGVLGLLDQRARGKIVIERRRRRADDHQRRPRIACCGDT